MGESAKIVSALVLTFLVGMAHGAEFHVSAKGRDENPGTADRPVASLAAAQKLARASLRNQAGPVTVLVHRGTYFLPETLTFTAEDSGSRQAPVTYAAAPGEEPTLSGGVSLSLNWEPHREGILKSKVPDGLAIDQLFINGESQPMARYPNFDASAQYFGGSAANAFSRDRARRWSDPRGGFIHAMHRHLWGDYHYLITGKDKNGDVTYEGGWQNNRQLGMHDKIRFVEGILEELDAPGEWFLDPKAKTLYLHPPVGVDLSKATVEGVRLRHLVEFQGTRQQPVKFVTLRGFRFRHAARTFMDNREPLLRSDWTTYRGGAVVFRGAEDCSLIDGTLDQLGGNGVFVTGYNRRITIRGGLITRVGSNGVAFVGDPKAVRSPLFEYNQRQKLADIDRTPGPKSDDYPADCLVEDCLIERSGRVEKQSSPVQISMSRGITIRHCSLYDVPRAGINISEGTWGGHVIEGCDVFDTVKETGDHGSFNSWGRDRYWGLEGTDLNEMTTQANNDLSRLDVVEPVILRNNRWRCDHGWDIDLDDGSTNYQITNNLCLNGGIKLREGFHRLVENNIMVANSFHPHVWYRNSQDVFQRNIVFTAYAPIEVPKPWGRACDFNLLHQAGLNPARPAARLQRQSGRDEHSVEGDALFVDASRGDYRVATGSPALKLGFQNFPMNDFGVRVPRLKAIARTPVLPSASSKVAAVDSAGRPAREATWLGAKIRDISGAGEVSATGLPEEVGILLVDVPEESPAALGGLGKSDVILKWDRQATRSVADLIRLAASAKPGTLVKIEIWRQQRAVSIQIQAAEPPH